MKNIAIAFVASILISSQAYGDTSTLTDEEAINKARSLFPPGAQVEISPEQARKIIDRMERMQGINSALMQAYSQQTNVATPKTDIPSNNISEEELAKQISVLPSRPTELRIEDRKDGFTINGQGYVDPEGTIRSYSIDPVSGLATYLAETSPNNYIVKVTRAGTGAEPVTIGTAKRNDGVWQAESRTGKRASGQNLSILKGGFLVSRETAAFLYVPGRGLKTIALPNGFVITRFQRGDVLGTGFLLMERIDSGNSAGRLIKGLGSLFGATQYDDYQLLNFETGETVSMNISRDGKEVGEYSECRKTSTLINKCGKVDFRESLYRDIGRNLSHYFWRINWYNTPSGPMLIAQENGLKDITIRNLKTGQKAILFTRTLGIAGYDSDQSADGKIHVSAKMGFSTETIDDAVEVLSRPERTVSLNKTDADQ